MPLPLYWLRDNCPCTACRDPRNGQKLFQITDLPDDLTISQQNRDEEQLTVIWSDGHRSRYQLDWLDEAHPGDHRTEQGKRLWQAADFAAGLPEAQWQEYLTNPAEQAAVLRAVQRLGFAVLRGVPAVDRQVLTVAETFGYVRQTNYGELFDVRVEPDPNNLAFTSVAIAPHTDNPYRDPVPTLQLLHCLENAAVGGDSGLVDGFRAADLLRAEAPEDFDGADPHPGPVRLPRPAHRAARRPAADRTDALGRIREVRFNNRSIGTLRLPAGRAGRLLRRLPPRSPRSPCAPSSSWSSGSGPATA